MLALAGRVRNPEEGQAELARLLENGSALQKFRQMVVVQGGRPECLDDPSLLPQAASSAMIYAPQDGYLREIDARKVGKVALLLGTGRAFKGDEIDAAAGLVLRHKVGDRVAKDDVLAIIFYSRDNVCDQACKELLNAFSFSEEPVDPLPLIHGVVPPFPS